MHNSHQTPLAFLPVEVSQIKILRQTVSRQYATKFNQTTNVMSAAAFSLSFFGGDGAIDQYSETRNHTNTLTVSSNLNDTTQHILVPGEHSLIVALCSIYNLFILFLLIAYLVLCFFSFEGNQYDRSAPSMHQHDGLPFGADSYTIIS